MRISATLALPLLFLLQTSLLAQERIRIAWAGGTPESSPIWVVQEKGLLKKQGVDAEIISISNSPTALQALLAGELDVIVTSVTTLVNSRLSGADVVMILGMVPTFPDYIVALPSVTSVEQLKGKIGAVNRLGTTSDLGLRIALRKMGIDPEKDVKLIAVGDGAARFAALSKGVVQFTTLNEPLVAMAEKSGFRSVAHVTSLKIPFWYNAVLSREATIKAKRLLLIKFCKAMTEAVHFIKTQKEATKAIFSKNVKIKDAESLERAYRDFASIFPETLYPTPEGVKTLLDDLAPRNPKAAAADPKSFVDISLVQEVEATGFTRQLYKR
ncbi:MAG TPA: ABC transporter substrate-binding protein [Candidatus Binatia bacterium]